MCSKIWGERYEEKNSAEDISHLMGRRQSQWPRSHYSSGDLQVKGEGNTLRHYNFHFSLFHFFLSAVPFNGYLHSYVNEISQRMVKRNNRQRIFTS